MLADTSAFLNNAVSLEKCLRLAQALTLTGGALAIDQRDVKAWVSTRVQISTARRFFRLHKWIDAGRNARLSFDQHTQTHDTVSLLQTFKQSFLSIYLLMEAPTIASHPHSRPISFGPLTPLRSLLRWKPESDYREQFDAVGFTETAWAGLLFREAQKFWFYAIVTSILICLVQLVGLATAASASREEPAEQNEKAKASSEERSPPDKGTTKQVPASLNANAMSLVAEQLVIECCDVFVPGSALGWTRMPALYVGVVMSVSSLLAMRQLWAQQTSKRLSVVHAKTE